MITPEQAIANVERRVRELRLEREWLNKEMGGIPVDDREIHCLFEGLCPTCGRSVALVRVGGTAEFLAAMVFMGDHEIDVWTYVPELGDHGGVEFECPCGHEHRVGYSFVSGDWS